MRNLTYKMMKKIIMLMLLALPIQLCAQDNTWEKPEEEETPEAQEKVNPDAKYLRGAVTMKDGQVVFTTHIAAPGKSASQIYDIIHQYMKKMLGEKNQIKSVMALEDKANGKVGVALTEWLVFKSSFIALDRTQLRYVLQADCHDGSADVTMSRISYIYGDQKDQQRYKAEEWITDKEAVNKKNTKLLPLSGKFRRKTIDRKDYLFNKLETLLK